MSKNKHVKKFQRAAARQGLYFFTWLLKHVPYGIVRFFAHLALALGFQFTIRHRRIAHESLTIAYGKEKSDKEIKQIIKKCFRNLGMAMIEMSYFLVHPEHVNSSVYMDGREHLDAALARGKGAIVVTAHFGNFPLMMFYCAMQGYKVSSIVRPARDEKMEEYLLKKRTDSGLKTIYAIPRKQCVSQCLEVLRNNEVLFVPLDQNSGSGGSVFVDFFGRKAATATGPVVLSRRTGAAIILMFIIHKENGMHQVIVEPEMKIEERDDNDEMLQVNIQKITNVIERYARTYPLEWGWMHRRWKSRPNPNQTKTKNSIKQ